LIEEVNGMNRIGGIVAACATVFVLALPAWQPVAAQPYGYPGGIGPPGYRQPYPAARPPAPAAREEASVEILAPRDGLTLGRGDVLTLEYAVDPGPKGDHVHVYVDGREVAMVRKLEGSYRVGRLRPGTHQVAIKVVNRAHVPIGVEQSISVNVR
jgi:hypothetical protein